MSRTLTPLEQWEDVKTKRQKLLAEVASEATLRWSSRPVTGASILREIEERRDKRFQALGLRGRTIMLGVGVLTIADNDEWIAHISYDFVTGKVRVMILGEPDGAMEFISDLTDNDMVLDALVKEYEKLQAPYTRRPIAGKKRSRSKIAPNQLEVGEAVMPVFGKPETGKKARKR